jgi:nitronate monooxygenase
MWKDRRLLEIFSINHPIIQAPMAGVTNVNSTIATGHCGVLASLGAANFKLDVLRRSVRDIRDAGVLVFNVNLFTMPEKTTDEEIALSPELRDLVLGYHDELNLGGLPELENIYGPTWDQLAVLVEEKVPVISFHFGVSSDLVEFAKSNGARVLCSATTVREAVELEAAGVDAVIAQGFEAGGHRGSFLSPDSPPNVGLFALVPQVVDSVSVPVVAAGGIMDARGVTAALQLGASGVQMGTAFLTCDEFSVSQEWRRQLAETHSEDTLITRAISGKPARAIPNRYVTELEVLDESFLPYPYQYSLSSKLRALANKEENRDFMVMWSGQGSRLGKRQSVSSFIKHLLRDCQMLLE